MGLSGGNLPFALETMGRADAHARDRVIGHFPGSVDGIAMNRLAEELAASARSYVVDLFSPEMIPCPTNQMLMLDRGAPG